MGKRTTENSNNTSDVSEVDVVNGKENNIKKHQRQKRCRPRCFCLRRRRYRRGRSCCFRCGGLCRGYQIISRREYRLLRLRRFRLRRSLWVTKWCSPVAATLPQFGSNSRPIWPTWSSCRITDIPSITRSISKDSPFPR